MIGRESSKAGRQGAGRATAKASKALGVLFCCYLAKFLHDCFELRSMMRARRAENKGKASSTLPSATKSTVCLTRHTCMLLMRFSTLRHSSSMMESEFVLAETLLCYHGSYLPGFVVLSSRIFAQCSPFKNLTSCRP